MSEENLRKVFLTFDVEGAPGKEDFLRKCERRIILRLLKLLEKHGLRGLFFFPGTVAEKIKDYPEILRLLRAHEIGYHSSSHSVRPRIFEYTDVRSYEEAFKTSLKRETSSIDPFTGSIRGKGGILGLRRIFPEKEIVSFRAPFLCWSPPHLEALREVGVKVDFSTAISDTPVFYKDITFMPSPIQVDKVSAKFVYSRQNVYKLLLRTLLKEKFTVLMMHPADLLFKLSKNFYEQYTNPFHPIQINFRSSVEIEFRFFVLDSFFSQLSLLQKLGLIEVIPSLKDSTEDLAPEKISVEKVYRSSVAFLLKFIAHKPRFLRSHFRHFFEDMKA